MSVSNHRRLLDRGRKAGLNASELYRALSASKPSPGDQSVGKPDCNGFIAEVQANGHRTFHTSRRENVIIPMNAVAVDTPTLMSIVWASEFQS